MAETKMSDEAFWLAKGYVKGADGSFSKPARCLAQIQREENVGLAAAMRIQKKSPLAVKFETLWRQLGGPELTPEFRFHPERKWRADYAHEGSRILIELEGAIFGVGKPCPKCGRRQQGGHGTARGMQEDAEKYNAASALGWRMFRLTTGMISETNITPIIASLKENH